MQSSIMPCPASTRSLFVHQITVNDYERRQLHDSHEDRVLDLGQPLTGLISLYFGSSDPPRSR